MTNKSLFAILTLLFVCSSLHAKGKFKHAFQDTTLTDKQRVELLMKELTLDEKVQLLSSTIGVPRLGIPACSHFEGLHGLAQGGAGAWGGRKRLDDGRTVPDDKPTTVFPQSYGLGATWDRDALRRVGEQTALEARYYTQSGKARQPSLIMRAPNADLARDPRWGRTEESFGEDPYLTAQLTVAMIHGLQGDHPRYWMTASLMKHFMANSNEDGRDSTSSDFDERLFREYYSFPFYKGITEGGSRAFMASYNAWNGVPMTIHPILNDITRKEWGNNGIICTDGGAFRLLVNAHHAFPTMAEGAAAIVKATVGQFLDTYRPAVEEALQKGLLTERDIDNAIWGNLFVALKLGLLDGDDSRNPYRAIGTDSTQLPPFREKTARQLAREIMAKSVVLLKNETVDGSRLLPINVQKVRKIALVGPYADKIVQDWYSGTPEEEVTILQGLREALKDSGVEILYTPDNRMGVAERMAAEADFVIVCTGNHPFGTKTDWFFCPVPSDGREAVDRKTMNLPDEDLVRQLHAVNPHTMLVLVSSFPYTINWCAENLPAIVHITHCAEEQGNGLADVLLGKVNPAGRTTQTWVKDMLDLPSVMDYDIRHGRTYMYARKPVLYPFGYGLSYTQFRYNEVKIRKQDRKKIWLTVSVTNTGDRDGEEVVQVYAQYPQSAVQRPQQQLCAFERVPIPAGATRDIDLVVEKSSLAYWDSAAHSFVVEQQPVNFLIGASSADIRLRTTVPCTSK